MKLSKEAKTYVESRVADEFREELSYTCEKLEAVRNAHKARLDAFVADLDRLEKSTIAELDKIVKNHGLKPNDAIDYNNRHVLFVAGSGTWPVYGSQKTFVGLEHEDCSCDPELREAKADLDSVVDTIQKATGRAIFEIEMHGRKTTLDKVIEEVVADFRAGRRNGK